MQLKNIGLVVAAVVGATGIWAVKRPVPDPTVTTSPKNSIDCYRGVSCPIVWSPPEDRK
jgi:hypothetical protein